MGEIRNCSFCEFPAPHIPFINDEGDSLQFVICIKNEEEKKKLVKLIQDRQGCAYTTLDKVNGNSAVLVDDDALTWEFDGDVFKLSYIQECAKQCKILDITRYLKQPSTTFVDGFEYMRIFYTREYTWNSVPLEYRLKTINHTPKSPAIPACKTQIEQRGKQKKKAKIGITELPTKDLFVSLKRLESLIGKTKQITVERPSKANNEEVNGSLPGSSGNTTNFPIKKENQMEDVKSSLTITSKTVSTSESENESDDSFKSSTITAVDNSTFGSDKKTRAAYSLAEKEAILRYIVRHNLYDYLKGVSIWKEMERNNICPIRTWQSMKEHTIKTLTKEIDRFKFLKPEEKHRIKYGVSRSQ